MMPGIQFRDFVPQIVAKGGTFTSPTLATMEGVVASANAFIRQSGIDVISVETLLLPLGESLDTTTGSVAEFNFGASKRFQAVRVWYRVPLDL